MVNANTELVLSKRQEPDTLRENHSLFFSSRNATASAPPDGFQPIIPFMRHVQESCSETNVLDVFPMYLAGWLHSEEAMPEKIIFHKHHEENHFHNGLFSFFCPFCDTCDFASV